MKKVLLLFMAIPCLVFSQEKTNFGQIQELSLRSGLTQFAQHSGYGFQIQYSTLIIPHLNFVVSDMYNNTYHKEYNTNNTDIVQCGSNSLMIGVGCTLDFLDKCRLGVDALVGLDYVSAVYSVGRLNQYIDFAASVGADLSYRMTEKVAIGVFGSMMFGSRNAGFGDGAKAVGSVGLEMRLNL